jgi:hypothetical protein
MDDTETLIAVLLGRVENPHKQQQLLEAAIPDYLLDEYNRMGAATELAKHCPQDIYAISAISYAATTDYAISVRMRCVQLLADATWDGKESVLICCTHDAESEVRLISLEALAVNQLKCTKIVAARLIYDVDYEVSDLALRLVRGDTSFPVRKLN